MNHSSVMKNLIDNKGLLAKIAGSIIVSFLIISVLAVFLVRQNLLQNEQAGLEELVKHVKQDLVYDSGNLNTTKYNADPSTPHPAGSSGFGSSLYIITTDGFVVERAHAINGILDSADFRHLSNFQTPQTINIVTNEQWRVLSQPIRADNGTIVGVAMVAYLNPQPQLIQMIDDKLRRNVNYILSTTAVKNDSVDVSRVEVRDVDYDVSFEIVNRFNSVLLNTGRVPTYIDPSYVEQELLKPMGSSEYTDPQTGKTYLLHKEKLADVSRKPVGIIVAGKSTDYINSLIRSIIPPLTLAAAIIIPILTGLVYSLIAKNLRKKVTPEEEEITTVPETISFDDQNSNLMLDGKTIQIPYATNQYELAKAVFSIPSKRWELDELLERFGETENLANWRKVYDATLALNKKAGIRVVVYKDKTFRLNPELTPHVKKLK